MAIRIIMSAGPRESEQHKYLSTSYRKNDADNLVWKLNTVAMHGACVIVAEAEDFFGGEGSKPYRSRVLRDPTWACLMRAAAAQAKATRDAHHVYLEAISVERTEAINGEAVKVCRLFMGS